MLVDEPTKRNGMGSCSGVIRLPKYDHHVCTPSLTPVLDPACTSELILNGSPYGTLMRVIFREHLMQLKNSFQRLYGGISEIASGRSLKSREMFA